MDSPEEVGSPKTYITLEAPKPKPPDPPPPPPPPPMVPVHAPTNNVSLSNDSAPNGRTIGTNGQEDKITKAMKQRYWHSWEELRLIELWRRYKNEVTDVRKSLPVFRKIVVGMRSFGFLINAQDCRRKINSLTNRYITEKRNMKTTKRKTDWNLYPLVDCIMEPDPRWGINDPWHECVIIKSLLDKIQSNSQLMQQINNDFTNRLKVPLPTNGPCVNVYNSSRFSAPPAARSMSHFQMSPPLVRIILPIHNITREKIENLRLDNERLLRQCDDLRQRLEIEEESFKSFRAWMEQQELLLKKLIM